MNDQGGAHCQGITPLHDAAANGHIEVVKVLLSHQASVNLKDRNVSMLLGYQISGWFTVQLILSFSKHYVIV